jgi:hypothetical protein
MDLLNIFKNNEVDKVSPQSSPPGLDIKVNETSSKKIIF